MYGPTLLPALDNQCHSTACRFHLSMNYRTWFCRCSASLSWFFRCYIGYYHIYFRGLSYPRLTRKNIEMALALSSFRDSLEARPRWCSPPPLLFLTFWPTKRPLKPSICSTNKCFTVTCEALHTVIAQCHIQGVHLQGPHSDSRNQLVALK